MLATSAANHKYFHRQRRVARKVKTQDKRYRLTCQLPLPNSRVDRQSVKDVLIHADASNDPTRITPSRLNHGTVRALIKYDATRHLTSHAAVGFRRHPDRASRRSSLARRRPSARADAPRCTHQRRSHRALRIHDRISMVGRCNNSLACNSAWLSPCGSRSRPSIAVASRHRRRRALRANQLQSGSKHPPTGFIAERQARLHARADPQANAPQRARAIGIFRFGGDGRALRRNHLSRLYSAIIPERIARLDRDRNTRCRGILFSRASLSRTPRLGRHIFRRRNFLRGLRLDRLAGPHNGSTFRRRPFRWPTSPPTIESSRDTGARRRIQHDVRQYRFKSVISFGQYAASNIDG
jgi:hypothetical protein